MQDATDAPDPTSSDATPSPADGGDGTSAPAAGGTAPAPPGPAGAAAGSTATATLCNLPEKPIAVLYNAMSTAWGDPFTATSRDLALKQYQGADTVLPMTVDNLMALPQGAGVMLMFAHGVFSPMFCIATSHVVNPADDARFDADLHPPAGQMPGLVTFDVPVAPTGAPVPAQATTKNYCITAAFVAKYWKAKFCQDSFALLCVCSVLDNSSDSAKQFAQVLQEQAGIGYLLGWDGTAVTTDMCSAAIFIFDRLLGTNDSAAKPEDPPQRPFYMTAVLADLANFTNVSGGPLNTSQGSLPGVTLATANLVAATDSDTCRFGILAPSILNLEMMAVQTKVAIAGWFGDDPGPDRGVVKINDTPVAYDSWTSNEIVCPLLVGDETGPVVGQAAGMVVVEVDGRPSNGMSLTEWRGKLVFTVTGEDSLKLVCTWTYHLKADMHHFRIKPGSDPSCFLDAQVGVFTLRDSSLTYQASGTMTVPGTDPPQHISWSGSGTLPPAIDMSDPRKTYAFAGQIVRPAPPALDGSYMMLGVVGGDGGTWTYNVKTDSGTSPTAAFGDWGDLCSSNPGPPFQGPMLKLPLDSQMGITAGDYPFTVGEHTCVLSIQPEAPKYPPDPTKGEDQSGLSFGVP